jgi:hypothetical protein
MKVRTVVSDSCSLYLHHCWRLVPPAILLSALPACPLLLFKPPLGEGLAGLLALPITFVLEALHVVESAEVREGRPRRVWQSAAELRPSLKPLVLMTALAILKLIIYFAVFVGAFLVALTHQNTGWEVAVAAAGIVGLVYLVARWSLLVPVVVLEGVSARKAFKRAGRLLGRHVLGVSAVLLVGSIAFAVVDAIATVVIRSSVSGEASRAFMEKVLSEPLTAPFLALLGTTAYFALREGRQPASQTDGGAVAAAA